MMKSFLRVNNIFGLKNILFAYLRLNRGTLSMEFLLLCSMVCLFLQQSSLVTARCGFPGTPAYGYVRPENAVYSEGDVASYACRVGYILLGSPISRCSRDGSWSEEVPICDDSMTTLGVAFSTPTVAGHAAELAIDRDKETCSYLKPKKPRWWRIDIGEEHKVLSVAVTMISPDKEVKFTVFVIQTQGTSASYKRCASFTGKFGTPTVVLSCAEGKGIVGEKVHIEDHHQMEGFFEICEVEVQVEKDTGYDCGRPSRSLYSINYEPENDMVEYGCTRGYHLKGSEYRNCLSTGQWSGKPPTCEPIICAKLEKLEYGNIRFSQGNNDPPLEGMVVIHKCDDGYKLEGPFTRVCLKDGSWSNKAPQCKAIRCPIPDGKNIGGVYRLINKTNSMGSMAMLRCKGGKREGDNPYISCTDDGTWTQPEARCSSPASATFARQDEPRIVNKGAIIFGMVVAAIMIVIVLVAMYLYSPKRSTSIPDIPSRLIEPPVPPPRPPPRTFQSAIMGCISPDPSENQEPPSAWKTRSMPSNHTYLKKEAYRRKLSYDETLPEDSPSVEKEIPSYDRSGMAEGNESNKGDSAAMDSEKECASKESIDSSFAASPQDDPENDLLPTENSSDKEEECEIEESEASSVQASEEIEDLKSEERKKERTIEEDRRKEEAKNAEQKKEDKPSEAPRRRRVQDDPVEDVKPVLRRIRKLK